MAQVCIYNLKKQQNSQHTSDDECGGRWQIVVQAGVAFLAGFLVVDLGKESFVEK